MPKPEFHALGHADQLELLGFERLRQAEEARAGACPLMKGKG